MKTLMMHIAKKLYEEYLNNPDPEKDEEFNLEDCKKDWGIF